MKINLNIQTTNYLDDEPPPSPPDPVSCRKVLTYLGLLISLIIAIAAVILFTFAFFTGIYYQQLYLECPDFVASFKNVSHVAECPPRHLMLVATILFPYANLVLALRLLVISPLCNQGCNVSRLKNMLYK